MFGLAGLAKCFEACGLRAWDVLLFEDGGEDGEGCVVGGGLSYFFWRVTGDCDQGISCRVCAGGGARATYIMLTVPHVSYFFWGDVL